MLLEILSASFLVGLVSLVGLALLPLREKLLDKIMFFVMSFAIGAIFAAAFFDLLPEALGKLGSKTVFAATLAGILCFFLLERIVRWHHGHHVNHEHEKPFAQLILVGDALHNFFDGIAISAAFLTSLPVGVSTTFAIIMHEIPHELSNYTLLLYGGFSREKALFYNFLSALIALVGAALFYYLSTIVSDLEALGIAFTAGTFIYIAGTDLVPELHNEENPRKSVLQFAAILVGIAVIWVTTAAFAE